MSYSPTTNPPSNIAGGGLTSGTLASLWFYSSADADVSGSYFSDGANRGMRVGDFVIATDTVTPQVNFHRVTALATLDPVHPNLTRAATLSTGVKIGN